MVYYLERKVNEQKEPIMMELQEIKTRNLKPGMELRDGRVAEVRRNLASRRMGWFVKLDNGHTVYVSRDTVKVYA